MASLGEDVYCTLVLSDSYLTGAAVLSHSLRDAGTKKKLAALVTLDTLSASTITQLKELYDYLLPVDRIRNPNPSNLYLMDRADLSFAFTKIHLWRQTQFRKIVYVDADIVALRAPDELFDIDAPFAAAPDVGWPDAFNSGVMVITPNMGDYWALQTLAAAGDSFDGADQGLLNQYYEHRNWYRMPFTYNTTPNAQYQWEPAYRYYKRDIRLVHFIGKDKPWTKGRQSAPGSGVYNELLNKWWAVHDRHLKLPQASGPSASSANFAPSNQSGQSTTTQPHLEGYATTSDTSSGFGTAAQGHSADIPEIVEPEGTTAHAEAPLTDLSDPAENIEQGLQEPVPTVEQRRFSAPQMEWDATRSAPPEESKPEAVNFPTQQYEFNESKQLFQPPKSYPEPPKDMWYQVPEVKPAVQERPKPIFPWEVERVAPKATRVFAEDFPSPQPTPWQPPSSNPPFPSQTSEIEADAGPSSPPGLPVNPQDTWQSFNQTASNAWDAVPGIGTYIRAVMEAQQPKKNRPGPIQIPSSPGHVLSPPINPGERHESLILTDFPSAVERPSLPVTPAPIRKPSFWGDERDSSGELPAAEGVPEQVDWVCPNCGFKSNASSFQPSSHDASDHPAATVTSKPAPILPVTSPAAAASPTVSKESQDVEEPASDVDEAILISLPPSPKTPPLPLTLHPPPSYHYSSLPAHLRPVPPPAPAAAAAPVATASPPASAAAKA